MEKMTVWIGCSVSRSDGRKLTPQMRETVGRELRRRPMWLDLDGMGGADERGGDFKFVVSKARVEGDADLGRRVEELEARLAEAVELVRGFLNTPAMNVDSIEDEPCEAEVVRRADDWLSAKYDKRFE